MARPNKLSVRDKRAITILAGKHYTQQAIARRFGVAHSTIGDTLRARGITSGKGFKQGMRRTVSPVAKLVATARVLLGK